MGDRRGLEIRINRLGHPYVYRSNADSDDTVRAERRAAEAKAARTAARAQCRTSTDKNERIALSMAEAGYGVRAVARYVTTHLAWLLVTGESPPRKDTWGNKE